MKFLSFLFFVFQISVSSAQMNLEQFFIKTNSFMYQYVTNGKVNYKEIKLTISNLTELTKFIEVNSLDSLNKNTKKAYLINVYNLSVIQQIISKYPIKSPMEITGFFETTKFNIGGKKMTLNYLENDILRKQYKDPRFHFVLVCGALGCPVIANYAYNPSDLEKQLEKQTKAALNNSKFVYQDDKGVFLSEIFNWYKIDFGGTDESTIKFINKYRKTPFSTTLKVQNYPYNWTLNEFKGKRNEIIVKAEIVEVIKDTISIESTLENSTISDSIIINTEQINSKVIVPVEFEKTTTDLAELNIIQETSNNVELQIPSDETINLQTYTAGSLLSKGKFDFTTFNTIYTQTKSNWLNVDYSGSRSTFFTSSLAILYGVSKSKRINAGIEINFKSSSKSVDSSFLSTFNAFSFKNNDSTRVGLSNIGLKLKFSPFKGINDFSIQSTLYIPTIKHPEGYSNPDGSGKGNLYWSDWNRYTSWTQFFYVKSFRKFQIFTEADLLFRIRKNKQQITHLDLPTTLILSYFPLPKITVYGIAQHTTRFTQNIYPDVATDWVIPMNYSSLGMGLKIQPVSNVTIEFLYTNFVRGINTGLGNTFNIGVKFLTK